MNWRGICFEREGKESEGVVLLVEGGIKGQGNKGEEGEEVEEEGGQDVGMFSDVSFLDSMNPEKDGIGKE